ncbi:oligosaccharide repeat unit polymerase [bacterium]|nr:oligosaccharide repeat unit polymerase [bacterium]
MPQHEVLMTEIMTFLCVGSCWLGHALRPRPGWVKTEGNPGDPNRLFLVGLAIGAVAVWAYAMMGMRTGGGVTGLFKAEGSYEADWEGGLVVLNLFGSFLYPAIAIVLISALRRPQVIRYLAFAAMCIIPLAVMVFLGRRGSSLAFLLMIMTVVYFYKGWTIPRWVFVAAAPTLLVAFVIAPEYRAHSQIGGDWSQIRNIRVADTMQKFSEEGSVEVMGGVYIIGAAQKSGQYRYGIDYYNGMVRLFVPRFIVGEEFKQGLMFDPGQRDKNTVQYYSWQREFYNFPFGPAVAFEQGAWFGCLVYIIIGAVMGTLWERSRRGSVFSQVFYVSILLRSLVVLVTDQTHMLAYPTYLLIFVAPPLLWAMHPTRLRRPRRRRRRAQHHHVPQLAAAHSKP